MSKSRSGERIAIIGAGLTGAWTAYLLAAKGLDVVIYDDFSRPFRASAYNPGGINPLHGPGIPGGMEPFQLACHRYHLDHEERIRALAKIDYRLRTIDRLFVALTEQDVAELRQMESLYHAAPGFESRWLEREQVYALEPRITDKALGGLLTRGNAVVDSALYNKALLHAALRLGARHDRRAVSALVGGDGHITHLDSGDVRHVCDKVIITNGCWASEFLEQLEFPVAINPVKGQMLIVRIEKPVNLDITCGLTGLYQYKEDLYWLGGTREDTTLAPGTDSAGKQKILENVLAMIPGLAGLQVVGHEAGYRPGSPDGLPLVGQVPGWDNVFVGGGSGSKGVLLCSGIATALAAMVQGRADGQYDFLAPRRFIQA